VSTTGGEPSNIEAEEEVLGCCLLSETAVDRAAELLEPHHFHFESHRTIFAAILGMRKRGEPSEALILASELERLQVLDKIGGRARIAELAALVPAVGNVSHYAALVLEAARSRSVYRSADAVKRAAENGGLSTHPELISEMRIALDEASILPGEPGLPQGPVFITAHDFAASHFAPPEPLLGTVETAVLAAGSLNLLAGRSGVGKTTLLLDMACHLAAGLPWPSAEKTEKAPKPWACPRPLRIAVIENEGPQEMFRGKVQDKLERFPHSIREAGGEIIIQTLNWGSFSFADRSIFERVRQELDNFEIDLVVGDPLASLGMEGVGSPAETMAFVQLIRPLGLGTHRAFLFLHHFRERVEKGEDELARLSGAWGGHLDTLITLAATSSEDQARLWFPKLRWNSKESPRPIILGRVRNTRSFEAIGEEGDSILLEPVIYEYLAESRSHNRYDRQGWQLLAEIALGIEARRAAVKNSLEGAGHLFKSVTGRDAKGLGAKSPRAILWGLAEWDDVDIPPEENPGQQELAEDGIPF